MLVCMVLPCYRPLPRQQSASDSTLDEEEDTAVLVEKKQPQAQVSSLKRPAPDEQLSPPPSPPEKQQCGVCKQVKPIREFERLVKNTRDTAEGKQQMIRSKYLCNACVPPLNKQQSNNK